MAAKIPGEETGICVKRGICGLCGGKCLVDAYCRDGRVIKVEGCRAPGLSGGRLCVKGAALKQALYSPERLLYPMKRVGKRGEGRFERISWDEALDTVAARLLESREKHGAKSTMLYVGHPKWFRPQITDFANKYGTPNLGTESSTCAYAMMLACKSCYGADVQLIMPDLARCKTLLLWGANPLHSGAPGMAGGYMAAVKRGVRVIAVDPRCTPTTEHAALHLRPVPGTDGALALGMARVIITEGLYDRGYVEKYTYGFEVYRDYVMDFTPERVERITGVPAGDMIAAARMFAENAPSAIQVSASPVVHNINGVQNSRAVVLLAALTGSYGRPGGVMAPAPARPVLKGAFMGERTRRVDAHQDLSHAQFPAWARLIYHEAQVSRIADYLSGQGDYPIHTLLAFGMNHHMWPRPDRVAAALEQVDFFVNADIYNNDTCKYADILLPVCTTMEREQVELMGPGLVYDQPPVIPPLGEARNDMEVLIALADRLGFSIGEPPMHSYEDHLRTLLLPTGLTLEELRAHPDGMQAPHLAPARTEEDILRVQTPTGKIEFVSTVLAECGRPGHEGLPVYHEYRDALPREAYPLILSTGCRKPQLFHSRTYRLPWLAGLETAPVVDIHPEDAARLDLADGEMVLLRTPVGAMELPARYDASCLPGVVCVYHGAGDKDINLLVDDTYLDPVSGFPGYKSYCCRLEKLEKKEGVS